MWDSDYHLIFLLFSEWRTGEIALLSLVSPSRRWYVQRFSREIAEKTHTQTDTHTQTGPIPYPRPLTREGTIVKILH